MITKYFSLLLSGLLLITITASPVNTRTALATTANPQDQEIKLKKRIVEWGTNKNVSIELKSGSKIAGRIVAIEDEAFSVQVVESGQVINREIRYSEIKYISGKNGSNGGKIAGWIVLGAVAAVGTLFLIGQALSD